MVRAILKGILCGLMLLISIAAGVVFYIWETTLLDFSSLKITAIEKPSLLLDDGGEVWGSFEKDRRAEIALEEVSPHLINAFIATEDHTFFSHRGVFLYGIIRSLLTNCYQGKIVQGASTITQQLAKLLFTNSERTFRRKIKDQLLALLIEQRFSKEQILQAYLNNIYFGAGIYGIEAASQKFWSKSATHLTLEEAATLAAIVKNPGHFCPLWFPLSAQRRRNLVLRSMESLSFISAQESKEAQEKPLALCIYQKQPCIAPHAKEAIRVQLENIIGKEKLYTGGYQIATTLNRTTQLYASEAFTIHIEHLRNTLEPEADGGLISLEVNTGQIKALIGGLDFTTSQFNRALSARRQLGSIFKLLVYVEALKKGFTFADTAVDEPIEVQQGTSLWSPHNATLTFQNAPRTLAWALHFSNNIITIKTAIAVGPANVAALAKQCNLGQAIPPYPSLALGCIDVTVKEAAGLFNIFANNGVYAEPFLIKWVKDKEGKKIFHQAVKTKVVIEPAVVGQVTKVLTAGIGRAFKRLKSEWKGGEAIAKTGTTNDSRTCWFAGATPELTTVIYVGCDDNRSLGHNVFASRTAFPIWQDLYTKLPQPKKFFTYASSLKPITIDFWTGALLPPDTKNNHAFSILIPHS